MSKKRTKAEKEYKPKHPARAKVIREGAYKYEPRTEGQRLFFQIMGEHAVTLAIGPAGSGKTFLTVVKAVQSLANGEVDRIILTRPAKEAAGERPGALPGDAVEKVFPYMIPLYESLSKVLGRNSLSRLMDLGIIEIAPLAYMRGRTFENAFIVIDEAQNACVEQFKMLMTRIGYGSKLVATGDLNQTDIPRRKRNGLEDAVLRFIGEDEIAVAKLGLGDIQRHPLVARIIKGYEVDLPEGADVKNIFIYT